MHSSDIFPHLQCILILSKAVSALPVTTWNSRYSIFMIILCTGAAACSQGSFLEDASNEGLTGKILKVVKLLRDLLMILLLTSGFRAHRKHNLSEPLGSLLKAHDVIVKQGLTPDYTKMATLLVAFAGLIHPAVRYQYEAHNEIFVFIFDRVISKIITHVYLLQFYALTGVVRNQLSTLIDGLLHEAPWFLESMVSIESGILKNAQAIFDMYKYFIFWIIIERSFSGTTHAYQAINGEPWKFFLLFSDFVSVVIVIFACSSTREKVEQFNAKLFKLMRESNNTDLCDNKKLQLHVLVMPTVNFTCGFFSLNYPLIISIVSAATTHLVILKQLSYPSLADPSTSSPN